MVTVVVVVNVLLALYGFHLAWQVWQLRRAFSQAADDFVAAEQSAQAFLRGASALLLRKQLSARQLRQTYQQLEPNFQRAQQALAFISLGRSLLLRRTRFLPFSRHLKKSATKRM